MQGMGFLTPGHLNELQTPLNDVWVATDPSPSSGLRLLVEPKKPFLYLWLDWLDRPQLHVYANGALHPVRLIKGLVDYHEGGEYEDNALQQLIGINIYDMALVKKSPFDNMSSGWLQGASSSVSEGKAATQEATEELWLPYRNSRMQVVVVEKRAPDPGITSKSYILSIDNKHANNTKVSSTGVFVVTASMASVFQTQPVCYSHGEYYYHYNANPHINRTVSLSIEELEPVVQSADTFEHVLVSRYDPSVKFTT